jgi:hypothetical protein
VVRLMFGNLRRLATGGLADQVVVKLRDGECRQTAGNSSETCSDDFHRRRNRYTSAVAPKVTRIPPGIFLTYFTTKPSLRLKAWKQSSPESKSYAGKPIGMPGLAITLQEGFELVREFARRLEI